MKNLTIELHPRQQSKELWMDIAVSNQGEAPVLLEKSDSIMPLLFEEAFEIQKTSDGSPISYTGPMAKRKALTINDFSPLNPGETLRKAIRLDNVYAFDDEASTYQARWYLLLWDHEKNGVGTLTSEWSAFSWH